MAGVASKNLFDVLGNDDSEEPQQPTKAIDKSGPRSGKRNAGPEAPARDAGRSAPRGGRHDNSTGSELAFRDRNAGRDQNRSKPSEEGFRQERRHEGGEYRGRGRGQGRGRGRGGPPRDDRHSKSGVTDHEKQVAHGWGGATGNEEFADEKAGEAIAQAEQKEEGAEAAADGEAAANPEAEAEPEDKTKSYAAWQAELDAKRAALGSDLEVRKANEGSSKKFPEGKAIVRGDEEDDSYIAGSGGKKKRERERKEKSLVELDNPKMYDQPREFSGRGRGSRGGRGEFRGGDGRGRGTSGRGGGPGRGEFRGGRGGRGGSQGPNVNDQNAFPSLGS